MARKCRKCKEEVALRLKNGEPPEKTVVCGECEARILGLRQEGALQQQLKQWTLNHETA